MATYRDTTRVGGCLHCGSSTVRACEGCDRFVCTACEAIHDDRCEGRRNWGISRGAGRP